MSVVICEICGKTHKGDDVKCVNCTKKVGFGTIISKDDNTIITEIKRIDDISIRKIEKKIDLLSSDYKTKEELEKEKIKNTQYELVEWYTSKVNEKEKELCYVLMFLRFHREEPKWEFVGNRPFEYKKEGGDLNKLWNLMEYGQIIFKAEIDFFENI